MAASESAICHSQVQLMIVLYLPVNLHLEGKYTECLIPQIRDQNWQSGIRTCSLIVAAIVPQSVRNIHFFTAEWPIPSLVLFQFLLVNPFCILQVNISILCGVGTQYICHHYISQYFYFTIAWIPQTQLWPHNWWCTRTGITILFFFIDNENTRTVKRYFNTEKTNQSFLLVLRFQSYIHKKIERTLLIFYDFYSLSEQLLIQGI